MCGAVGCADFISFDYYLGLLVEQELKDDLILVNLYEKFIKLVEFGETVEADLLGK